MQGRYIFLTPKSTIQKSEAQETGKQALAHDCLHGHFANQDPTQKQTPCMLA